MIKLTYFVPKQVNDYTEYVFEVVYLKDKEELEFILSQIDESDIFDIEF